MKWVLFSLPILMLVNTVVFADDVKTAVKKQTKQSKKISHSSFKDKSVAKIPAKSADDDDDDDENKEDNSGISGNLDLTSNYIFRGISQTQDKPAVQGGFTYTFPVGLYFDVWGSNVHFIVPNGAMATSELDTMAGWIGNIGNVFSYDINLSRYFYPGARYGDYNDFGVLLTYRFFQLGMNYTSNYFGTHARGLYTNGTFSFDIPPAYVLNFQGINIQVEFGHYAIGRFEGINTSYNDYSFTVNKKINDTYTVTAQWTDTNGRAKQSPYDGNQILGTVTANF